MMKSLLTGLVFGLIASSVWSTNAAFASITEGFEGSSYNLAGAGLGTASLVTQPPGQVLSGLQSVQLSLTTSSDYARVKVDTSSYNLTLGEITSADYWVDRVAGASSSQLPYLLLSITTPGGGNDNTLAVMYNNPTSTSGWTDLTVGPSTLFHVEGVQTGLSNPSSIMLADLASSIYSPGVSWGSFAVDFVRIGYGQGGNDGVASTSYVDDLTINTASASAPEPVSLIVWSLLGLTIGGLCLQKRKCLKPSAS